MIIRCFVIISSRSYRLITLPVDDCAEDDRHALHLRSRSLGRERDVSSLKARRVYFSYVILLLFTLGNLGL